MKGLFFRMIIAASGFVSLYTISERSARADEWGCQVILCLSNPGGPTQYGECRPPVEKLWRWLAKGRSFPTCAGVGFQTSRPLYEPYYCNMATAYLLATVPGDVTRRAFPSHCKP